MHPSLAGIFSRNLVSSFNVSLAEVSIWFPGFVPVSNATIHRTSRFFGKVYGGSLYTLSEQQLVEAWNWRRPRNAQIRVVALKGGDCKGIPPSLLYSVLWIKVARILVYKDINYDACNCSSGVWIKILNWPDNIFVNPGIQSDSAISHSHLRHIRYQRLCQQISILNHEHMCNWLGVEQ